MGTKFLLLMGPSGVGKNAIMSELARQEERFIPIKPHMTRPLRPGETQRVQVTLKELMDMRRRGEATLINGIYGGEYYSAMPKKVIEDAISRGNFPMVDYKVSTLRADLEIEFPGQLFRVYILPPVFGILKTRLERAGRIHSCGRATEDWREMQELDSKYGNLIDLKVTNRQNRLTEAAATIRKAYMRSLPWYERFAPISRLASFAKMIRTAENDPWYLSGSIG